MANRRGGSVRWACALAGLAMVPLAASASERLVIPFQLNRFDHMVVDMEVNDATRTTGVVDTAATFAMVDSNVALRSGISPPGKTARQVNILGVNGDRMFPVVELESVKAGNVRLSGMSAAYNEDIEVLGAATNVLPASAFPGDVLEFDFTARRILAYDGKPDASKRDYSDSLPYTVEGGLIFVNVHVNGKRGRALIDTGSSISYVNSVFAREASMRRNDDLTRKIFGATGDEEEGWVTTVRKVRLADFFFERPNLLVSDPVLLEKLELHNEPVMILGLDILSKFRVQFDRRRERLILSVPGDAVGGVELELQARATRLKD